MPVNNFLVWATDVGANVETQADYAADAARGPGVIAGIATSALYNKAQRQSSFWAAVLGQFTANQTGDDVLDDGDVADKITLFQNAILALTSFYATAVNLAAEIARATAAEGVLTGNLATVAANLAAEITRATTAEALLAPKASPTFTGDPKAPTPANNDNDTSIATTAFVQNEIGNFRIRDLTTADSPYTLVKDDIGRLIRTDSAGIPITVIIPPGIFDFGDHFYMFGYSATCNLNRGAGVKLFLAGEPGHTDANRFIGIYGVGLLFKGEGGADTFVITNQGGVV